MPISDNQENTRDWFGYSTAFEFIKNGILSRIEKYTNDREQQVEHTRDINEIKISIESLRDRVSERNLEPLRAELDEKVKASKEIMQKHDDSLEDLNRDKALMLKVLKETHSLYVSLMAALHHNKIEDPMILEMARLIYDSEYKTIPDLRGSLDIGGSRDIGSLDIGSRDNGGDIGECTEEIPPIKVKVQVGVKEFDPSRKEFLNFKEMVNQVKTEIS